MDGVLDKKCPFLDARSLGRILSKQPSKNKIREFKQESQAEIEKHVFMNKKIILILTRIEFLIRNVLFWMPGL